MHEVVAGTCRQYQHVASLNRHVMTTFSAQRQSCASGGKAEHLVGCGVIVMEGVNAVLPLGGSEITSERLFHLVVHGVAAKSSPVQQRR